MGIFKNFILWILLFGFLQACTQMPKEQFLKRYKEDIPVTEKEKFYNPTATKGSKGRDLRGIVITPFIMPPPSTKKSDFSKLPERAQKEFIKQSAELTGDLTIWKKSLVEPFKPDEKDKKSPRAKKDYSKLKFKKRFSISVQTERFLPADRLDWLKVTIELPKGLKFTGFSELQNKYETIKPGTLEVNQKNTTEFSLDLQTPIPIAPTGSFTAGSEASLKETLDLSYKRVVLTGGLSTDKTSAYIVQKGAFALDLTGIVHLDGTFEINPNSGYADSEKFRKFEKLYNDKNKPNKPGKITYKTTQVFYPVGHEDYCQSDSSGSEKLVMNVTFKTEGRGRFVKNGDKTISEGDDVLFDLPFTPVFQKDEDGKPEQSYEIIIPLDKPKAFNVYGYFIRDLSAKKLECYNPDSTLCQGTLYFQTFEDAQQFLNWLLAEKPAFSDNKTIRMSSAINQKMVKIGERDYSFDLNIPKDKKDKPDYNGLFVYFEHLNKCQ